MINSIRRWFEVRHHYGDQLDRYRAAALMQFAGLVILTAGLAQILIITALWRSDPETAIRSTLVIGLGIGMTITFIRMIQRGQLQQASLLAVGISLPAAIVVVINRGINDPTLMALAIPSVMAGLLLNRRDLLITASIVIVSAIGIVFAEYGSLAPLFSRDLIVPLFILFLFPALHLILGGAGHIAFIRFQAQFERLKTVGDFNIKPDATDETAILYVALNMIRERLNYDFAQVYMVDPPGVITRRLRAGEGATFSDAHVNDASALNTVIRHGLPVRLNPQDSYLMRSHFQPSSRFGVVIPIKIQDETVALLDVQDDQESFTEEDVIPLQALAGRMARALHDARELKVLTERIHDQEAALEKTRSQLAALRQRTQETVTDLWDEYIVQRGSSAFGFDSDGETTTVAYDLPETLRETLLRDGIHIEQHESMQIISVPIMLRGEVLGAMAFHVPAGKRISDRQRNVMRIVTNRLALALDNKRLFEQNEARATRERTANEIAALLIGATDVDSVLALAATNFNEVLGAVSTRIHLQPLAISTPNQP